jgi:hypothetical protein
MATGTVTGFVVPLSVSLPAISNLPSPSALMAPDWKLACGKCAASNQGALGSSASLIGMPKPALAVSICSATVPPSGFLGSKATWASNFLNAAFHRHAHLLADEDDLALVGHQPGGRGLGERRQRRGEGRHEGDEMAPRWPVPKGGRRKRWGSSGGFLAWRGPHAFQKTVAVDPVVLEHGRHVQQRDARQREGAVAVQRLQHGLGKGLV